MLGEHIQVLSLQCKGKYKKLYKGQSLGKTLTLSLITNIECSERAIRLVRRFALSGTNCHYLIRSRRIDDLGNLTRECLSSVYCIFTGWPNGILHWKLNYTPCRMYSHRIYGQIGYMVNFHKQKPWNICPQWGEISSSMLCCMRAIAPYLP